MGCGASKEFDPEPVNATQNPHLAASFKLPDYEALKQENMEQKQALDLLKQREAIEDAAKEMGYVPQNQAVEPVDSGTARGMVSDDEDSFISSDLEALEETEMDGTFDTEFEMIEEDDSADAGSADGRRTVKFSEEVHVASGLKGVYAAFETRKSSKSILKSSAATQEDEEGDESRNSVNRTSEVPVANLTGRFEEKPDEEGIVEEKPHFQSADYLIPPEMQEKLAKYKKTAKKTKKKVRKEDMQITRAPLQTEKVQMKHAPIYASIAPEYETIVALKV